MSRERSSFGVGGDTRATFGYTGCRWAAEGSLLGQTNLKYIPCMLAYVQTPGPIHSRGRLYTSYPGLGLTCFCRQHPVYNSYSYKIIYHISSNNSRPSINCLPRIIAPPCRKDLKQSPPSNNRPFPALLAIFFSFYPLPVKLRCNEIQQNWSVTIQALKIIKELNLEHLKSPGPV